MSPINASKDELVWPGKYKDDGSLLETARVSLPFQVVETINESRARREARKVPQQGTLFEVYHGQEGDTFEAGWKNKLIWGDNLPVMSSLLARFAGKVDLIYIDPPFATGADFSFSAPIGDGELETTKEQSVIEEKAYRDTWGHGLSSYLTMMYQRLSLIHELIAPTGTLYVHCDARVNYALRALLDEIFGKENLRNELIWCYRGGGTPVKDFAAKHDTILRYSKSSNYYFDVDAVRVPYSDASAERLKNQANVFRGDKIYRDYEQNKLGKHPEDWWPIQPIMPSERQERSISYYPTQKPVELLQRIIDSSVPPNGLVLDAFCGSGTTMVVAEGVRVARDEKNTKRLEMTGKKRRWIGCDLGRWAVHTSRKRLLAIESCQPFDILNLGKYERQYWQGLAFGSQNAPSEEHAIFEYIAFVLKLYGAQPITGMAQLHGKKNRAMVHVGSVSAPVTFDEVLASVKECTETKQPELHVLGWEWEMGLNDLVLGEAKKRGVKLHLLQIPREVMESQAAARGDVRFFELAYLEIEVKHLKNLGIQLQLTDFVIADTELIHEDIRKKVRKWSDWIDYWAVDWAFHNDTFVQSWVAYRTLQDRSLPLRSDSHTYGESGSYRVVVKVVDIFGNDTSRALDVEVR